MFNEWDKIERELRDESPERTVFTVWMYVGVVTFVAILVSLVIGGQ